MSMQSRTAVLLIEDSVPDAMLLREMIREHRASGIELAVVASMSQAAIHLSEFAVDIILLDLGLPDVQGLEAVRRARAIAPDIPVVVLTGLDDESLSVLALHEGAQDYLIKGQIDARGLLRALRYATERKSMEIAALAMGRKLAHSAEHDLLTDLPNRTLLNDRIRQAILLAQRHTKKVAVLFLDLDGFKHINDSLGHPAGDLLLKSVAKRLVDCVRESDTVSRLGGDEFVVLLPEVEDAEDATVTARKILQMIADAHSIDQRDLHITASIGVSVYPEDGPDAETLIKNADTAMYQAKGAGRQSIRFFELAMNVRAVERQSIEEDLRGALERKEFVLHYQPTIDLRTGKVTGAEALLRWAHPTRGLMFPAGFIPVAEDCGLILPIGAWVLREASEQARAWAGGGLPPVSMAVNVSASEFQDRDFLVGLFKVLHQTGLDAKLLILELTESALIKRADFTAPILQAVRERGIQVAVDDFGTGYSSLSYLQYLSIDAIKIDQSFIRQISTAGDDTAIVTAVIAMARSLKLRVIAEGVETLEELAFLRAYQCDEAQGYYFSRPVPAHEFANLLRTGIPEASSSGHHATAMAS